MHVMPSDHTSTLPSYWPSSIARITSGAIQYGVPTNELAGHTIDADPKSAETRATRSQLSLTKMRSSVRWYDVKNALKRDSRKYAASRHDQGGVRCVDFPLFHVAHVSDNTDRLLTQLHSAFHR